MLFESFWLNFCVSLALIVALTLDYVTKFFRYWYVRHIPYKSSVPFFGSDYHRVLGLRSNTEEINKLYNDNPKAEFVGSVKSRIPDVIIKDPDFIKKVLSTDFEYFRSRGLDLDKAQDVCLRDNAFYAEGERWTVLRYALESILSDLKHSDVVHECLSGTNGNTNVQELLAKILDVVFKNLLLKDEDSTIITEIRSTLQKRTALDKLKSYLKSVFPSIYVLLGLNTLSRKPSRNTIENLKSSTLSKKIKTLFEENKVNKLKTNPENLTYGIIASVIADGYMPCLNVLTALIYELSRNLQMQEKARTEKNFLECAVKEALRLHPPYSVITRKCLKTYKFSENQVLLDRGVTVNIPVDAMHKDITYYKDANQFRPDRFMDGNTLNSFAYLPFGVGPRKCIGEQLAMEIIQNVTETILNKFEIKTTAETPAQLPMADFNFGRVVDADIWLRFEPI